MATITRPTATRTVVEGHRPIAAADAATADVARAERRLYDAETALHAARQSGVDAWVAAAYDRLHEAILDHAATLARRSGDANAGAGRADHLA